MVRENTVSGQTYGVYCPFSLKTKTFSLIWAHRPVKSYYGNCLCKQVQLVCPSFYNRPCELNNTVQLSCLVMNYFPYFSAFCLFQSMCMCPRIELRMLIKATDLWSSEAKKMPTMYVCFCFQYCRYHSFQILVYIRKF